MISRFSSGRWQEFRPRVENLARPEPILRRPSSPPPERSLPAFMLSGKNALIVEAPARDNAFATTSQYNNGYSGTSTKPGTIAPNYIQQQWLADVTTKAVLPQFEAEAKPKPFILLFWARDPDATQHNQGDSLGNLYPGINGPSSLSAIQNTDRNLRQILDWLDAHPSVKEKTDLFVTSDHGFATISRLEIDRIVHPTKSESAQHYYLDANGKVEAEKGTLPTAFWRRTLMQKMLRLVEKNLNQY